MASYSGQCPLCNGLRGHQRIKDAMFDTFNADYKQSRIEVKQLTALYKDVCWYNFETTCRSWKAPWHISWEESPISLQKYYTGSIRDAPPLPPEIVFVELQNAVAYMQHMRKQRYAPYDYAPGGREYERLLRHSPGVAAYDTLHEHWRRESSKPPNE